MMDDSKRKTVRNEVVFITIPLSGGNLWEFSEWRLTIVADIRLQARSVSMESKMETSASPQAKDK